MFRQFKLFNGSLEELPSEKQLITTINAHSFNTVKRDPLFCEALQASDILLPDGISMVLGARWLQGKKIRKIAGDDLFKYEMGRIHEKGGTCFFLGSSDTTLIRIKERAAQEYPGMKVYSYSPPFKPEFSEEESIAMVELVNEVEPDVLFVGMTAPKQEKWAFKYFSRINAGHVCCVGAVFDFYAGSVQRAPKWMIEAGMEWFYRLAREPRRMWKRYLIGNALFLIEMVKAKFLLLVPPSSEPMNSSKSEQA